MTRLLYLMHVPWGWIKQRPHFIAEQLGKHFKQSVFFRKAYRRSNLLGNAISGHLEAHELFTLPFNKLKFISMLNAWLIGYQLRSRIKQYEIVWVTHPEMYVAIRSFLPHGTQLVYDCMDDALEFPHVRKDHKLRSRIAGIERQLIERSSVVFASSEYLKTCLNNRYDVSREITVVNNGVTLDSSRKDQRLVADLEAAFNLTRLKRIVYIGTISDWLDIDLILKSLEMISDIAYFFVGPSECSLPKHDRMFNLGPVEHGFVPVIMEYADVLVMPFSVTDLILSVNPVKVYEYIGSGKPTIVVRYSETEKFGEYVYLYHDGDEYIELLKNMLKNSLPPRKSKEECLCFIKANTWEHRVDEMLKAVVPKAIR